MNLTPILLIAHECYECEPVQGDRGSCRWSKELLAAAGCDARKGEQSQYKPSGREDPRESDPRKQSSTR